MDGGLRKFHVLIVGCGDLGSRHLQAIAGLSQIGSIEVVDPNPASLETARNRLKDVRWTSNTLPEIRWATSLNEAGKKADLCILATKADVRLGVIQEMIENFQISKFLLEKVVVQSVEDYQSLLEWIQKRSLSMWVNCKARGYVFHKRICSQLNPEEPIQYSVIGGNHGLANNGVHAADLFTFLDRSEQLDYLGGHVDSVLHSSKRGKNFFDLSGTLYGSTPKGSHFALSFSKDSGVFPVFSLVSRNYRAIVDELTQTLWESTLDSGWGWNQVSYNENLLVSHMTKTFALDILERGNCELPTVQECFPAHQFILKALLPHFNRLMGRSAGASPVT